MNKKVWKIAGVAMIVLGLPSGASYLHEQWVIRNLTQFQGQQDDRGPRLPQDPASSVRWKRFNTIWQTRTKQDVTGLIIPFLRDPFRPLRIRAVRALGQLENPKGQVPLQAILRGMKTEEDGFKGGGIPSTTLHLAIGRISSNKLKGRAKITRMTKEVGLTWPALVRLSQTVNGSSHEQMKETQGGEIMSEVVNLLYAMGKKGEKVEMIAKPLSLMPAQRVRVQASSLSSSAESKLVLDYLSTLNMVRGDDYDLMQHFVDLGPVATTSTLARLQQMKQNPQKYQGLEPYPGHPGMFRKRSSSSTVFRVAAQLGDKRVIPFLKHFQQSSDPSTRREATVALQMINP